MITEEEHRAAVIELADGVRDRILEKLLRPKNMAKGGWRDTAGGLLHAGFLLEHAELNEAVNYGNLDQIEEELVDSIVMFAMLRDPKRTGPRMSTNGGNWKGPGRICRCGFYSRAKRSTVRAQIMRRHFLKDGHGEIR